MTRIIYEAGVEALHPEIIPDCTVAQAMLLPSLPVIPDANGSWYNTVPVNGKKPGSVRYPGMPLLVSYETECLEAGGRPAYSYKVLCQNDNQLPQTLDHVQLVPDGISGFLFLPFYEGELEEVLVIDAGGEIHFPIPHLLPGLVKALSYAQASARTKTAQALVRKYDDLLAKRMH